ncbi:MAG TPA: hypothetical protein VI759_09305 [Dehalococcoidia bacterium]|nr:hypothetical protein [Dehalococcoidia bacterium]
MAAKTAKPRSRKDVAGRFYEEALTSAEAADLGEALAVDGVDQEIALLRLRLRTVVEAQPDQLELMLKGIDRLVKLVGTRYRLSKQAQHELAAVLTHDINGLSDAWTGDDANG